MYFHLKNFNSKHNGRNTNFLPQQFGNSHVQDIHREFSMTGFPISVAGIQPKATVENLQFLIYENASTKATEWTGALIGSLYLAYRRELHRLEPREPRSLDP